MIINTLLNKFVKIKTNKDTWIGKVEDFHKHIDGGVILSNAYCLETGKAHSSIIICKLCLPEYGQGNYKTTISIENNTFILTHESNRNPDDCQKDAIELLLP